MSRLLITPRLFERGALVGAFGDAEPARRARALLSALCNPGEQASFLFTDGESCQADEAALGRPARGVIGQSREDGAGLLSCELRGEPLGLSMEGSLLEAASIRRDLQDRGCVLRSERDAELLLHRLAQSTQGTFINRLVDALRGLRGGWALLSLSPERLVAVRDPLGLRTLWVGRMPGVVLFCGESGPLRAAGARSVRELHPGEMVIVDGAGVSAISPFPRVPHHLCSRDAVARVRDDGDLFGHPVYRLRLLFGERLAQLAPAEADAVLGLPPGGLVPAQGFARASGLPLVHALLPAAGDRTYTAVRAACEGQRVVLVSRSLSTGTRARAAVRALREAGAARVHLRIASPLTVGACLYGVGLPDPETLLSASDDRVQAGVFPGADSVAFLGMEALREALGATSACAGCFTGAYPVLPELGDGVQQLPLFAGDAEGAL